MMRRQVKPFVTEYRGSPRRAKDLHVSGDIQLGPQAQRSRSYAEAEKAFHGETSDDSYEAALRAADALFDAPPHDIEPGGAKTTPEPERMSSETSSFWKPIASISGLSDEDGVSPGDLSERDTASSPRRILQAIEPPVEDRFAALEAERAPKRRGRKPGSKNKPKLVVGDDWAIARPQLTSSVEESAAAPTPAALWDASPVLASPEPAEISVDDADGGNQGLPQPRGRNDKFGWKRAGLRPGERWKRRLPKTAW